MLAIFKTIILLVVALLLAAAALLIPAHLRSIDLAVLQAHAKQADAGHAVDVVLNESIRSAHIGSTLRILNGTRTRPDRRQPYQAQIRELLEQRPSLLASGGPDRTLEDFLELVQAKPSATAGIEPRPLLPQLLPRSERASLSSMLAESTNANVAALLGARDIVGLLRLHPASHAAGAPYDAGILSLALLIEGGHFSPALAQKIGQTAAQANLGTPAAVRALEDFAIATLSLGRQLDHRSLADLAHITQSLSDWGEMGTLFRAQPDRIDALYTALRFEGSSSPIFSYLASYPDTGKQDLDAALSYGPQATQEILREALPIYHAKAGLAATVIPFLSQYRPHSLVELSQNNREGALALKAGLFVLSGLAFALAMGAAWRASIQETKSQKTLARSTPSIVARNVFISLVVALTLWTLFEPEVLKSSNTETDSDSAPRIEFVVADTLESLKSPVKAMQELNQVTLLVLALFFITQLVIYCFCLIKLKEIAKQKLSASLKLKLLENEENLFDFGLYFGLGGTVLSLILVAVGIVEASLMAAYASTLFGILFVAMLKVINLRPYRRHLIIQASSETHDSEVSLMKNIEL
ncbi:hypothetical protein QEH52_00490 [Coraliomargarita sp. SDUM461003]|uniref:Uncharacterized protein n=1 Tax=Thalassobacterium maritimum TaxID=3041265 RepID=A0ABU1APE2_9BACT|nr:hypothetical protein [Coraliomargarita sp. SDUM461003]MDQ8205971.1 hypothetical protein [Coraliomargarita sp. SDUM461003]